MELHKRSLKTILWIKFDWKIIRLMPFWGCNIQEVRIERFHTNHIGTSIWQLQTVEQTMNKLSCQMLLWQIQEDCVNSFHKTLSESHQAWSFLSSLIDESSLRWNVWYRHVRFVGPNCGCLGGFSHCSGLLEFHKRWDRQWNLLPTINGSSHILVPIGETPYSHFPLKLSSNLQNLSRLISSLPVGPSLLSILSTGKRESEDKSLKGCRKEDVFGSILKRMPFWISCVPYILVPFLMTLHSLSVKKRFGFSFV